MAEEGFKKGDRVIKARSFSPIRYCRHGGHSYEVPIGTKGVIDKEVESNESIQVRFDNRVVWSVDSHELDYEETPVQRAERLKKGAEEKALRDLELQKKMKEEFLKKYKLNTILFPTSRDDNNWVKVTGEPAERDGILYVPVTDKRGRTSEKRAGDLQAGYMKITGSRTGIDIANPESGPLLKRASMLKLGLERKKFHPVYVELDWDEGVLKLFITFNEMPDEQKLLDTLNDLVIQRDTASKTILPLTKSENQLVYKVGETVTEGKVDLDAVLERRIKSNPRSI